MGYYDFYETTSEKGVFEGDSKLCLEAINLRGRLASWHSLAVILDILSMSVDFEFCCFNWIP